MAVRRARFAGRSPKRSSVWIGAAAGPTAVGAGISGLLATLNAASLALRPFTVVRTRLWLHVNSDQQAAGELVAGAFAMIVVSDQAISTGIGAIPQPTSNTDAPYFVYEPFVNQIEFGTAVGFNDGTGTNWIVDSKAMRKVGNNEDIAMVAENASGAGQGINISLIGRMLVKLH